MRKQDFLIHLIQSLSPNESRYFKLFSSIQPGEKEYVKLFEALQGKTAYDTEALSTELGITPAQLAEKKHYLSQVLIKSLQNYEEQTSDIAAVYRAKEEAVTLLGRRLFEYTLDHINKALGKAWELELFELIAEMLLTKYSCLYAMRRYDELPQITIDSKKAAAALAELFEIYDLRARATSYDQSGNKAAEFKLLMKHPLLKAKVENLKSLKAQVAWFHVNVCYLATDKKDNSVFLKMAQAELAHYKRHPGVKVISPVAYFVSYIRLAEAESLAGKYEASIKTCETLKSVIQPSPQMSKVRVESLLGFTNGFMITQLRYLKKYKEALSGIEKSSAGMAQRPAHEVYDYNFNYAVTLLNLKRTEVAVDIIDELLKAKEDVTAGASLFVRPLQIVAQLDMDNYQLVPYLIKSAKAWMKRQKISSPEIDAFFSFTYAIATSADTQRRQRWLKLKEAVGQHKLKSLEEELNLSGWLEQKLKRAA